MASPYSPSFVERQKDRLLEEKARLEQDLAKVATYDKDEGTYMPRFEEVNPGESEDNEEAADEAVSYEDNAAQTQDLVRSLDEVNLALKKIEGGTYGTCEDSGEWISEERLRAYPAARTSIDTDNK
ncbi:hypothetical protein A2V68_02480 [candidate division Kazan bacterium RBG_13_50_9]|uniref:Zinc finger DksA/TraR C4-type domain-containing protein n=1 Tax=candidate division Kazan bacterium RBG_13_50_9 TaxID=1798535 RepID=A0A1F4NT55_UNCK3|nr:MAG: hypothetical protein A2V68_02480 [candidate division Kazan bacterium RBG_13_50_9]